MEISYVLAGYNEEKIICEAIEKCIIMLERDFDDYELILVNDASKDNTGKIMEHFAENNSKIKYIDNNVNLNFGTSVLRGVVSATKEYVVYNAVDLPFSPNDTKEVMNMAREYDVLVLERQNYKTVRWRKITSNLNCILLKLLFPRLMKGTPVLNYVQVFKKDIIPEIIPLARSPIFVWPEMIFRAKMKGLKVGNIKNTPDIKEVRAGAFGHPHDIIWGIYEMFRFRIRCWKHNI